MYGLIRKIDNDILILMNHIHVGQKLFILKYNLFNVLF